MGVEHFQQVHPGGPALLGFENECGEDDTTADSNLEGIYCDVHNPQRSSLPPVLVVDYWMPDMDGMKLCEAAVDLPCKKTLFAACADAGCRRGHWSCCNPSAHLQAAA